MVASDIIRWLQKGLSASEERMVGTHGQSVLENIDSNPHNFQF